MSHSSHRGELWDFFTWNCESSPDVCFPILVFGAPKPPHLEQRMSEASIEYGGPRRLSVAGQPAPDCDCSQGMPSSPERIFDPTVVPEITFLCLTFDLTL